jgi:hypothetical protein
MFQPAYSKSNIGIYPFWVEPEQLPLSAGGFADRFEALLALIDGRARVNWMLPRRASALP